MVAAALGGFAAAAAYTLYRSVTIPGRVIETGRHGGELVASVLSAHGTGWRGSRLLCGVDTTHLACHLASSVRDWCPFIPCALPLPLQASSSCSRLSVSYCRIPKEGVVDQRVASAPRAVGVGSPLGGRFADQLMVLCGRKCA